MGDPQNTDHEQDEHQKIYQQAGKTIRFQKHLIRIKTDLELSKWPYKMALRERVTNWNAWLPLRAPLGVAASSRGRAAKGSTKGTSLAWVQGMIQPKSI